MAVTYLLDVNVLLALFWREHEDHVAVRAWFDASVESWASAPITQLGFVRVLSLTSVSKGFVSPSEAMRLLDRNLTNPRHVFWPADIEFVQPVRSTCQTLIGSKQVTDAYLVALAGRHGGRLATMDRGIAELAKTECARDLVEVLDLPPRLPGVQ
jgi:uncharacterized protein